MKVLGLKGTSCSQTSVTSSLEEENASRMTVLSSGWLLRSTWCPTSPNESRASSLMESVERLFFTSCPTGNRKKLVPKPALGRVRTALERVGHLDELSDHGGAFGGTGSGQSCHALGDGAVGLFVRKGGALRVNGTRQHPEQVHITQTGCVSGHESLERDTHTQVL